MTKHGHFHWNELNTRDPDLARAFYGATLGWTFSDMPMEEGVYWVAMMDGCPVAGIFTMTSPDFDGLPEHWFSYLAVDDVDARVRQALKAGADLIRPPFDAPGAGRLAIVRDPSGAVLGWITPEAGSEQTGS